MTSEATPGALRLHTQLGPLPEASTRTDRHIDGYGEPAFTEDDMRAYAAQEVAAERERWRASVFALWECSREAAPDMEPDEYAAWLAAGKILGA